MAEEAESERLRRLGWDWLRKTRRDIRAREAAEALQTDAGLLKALPAMIQVHRTIAENTDNNYYIRDLSAKTYQVMEHAERRLKELLKDEALRQWGESSNFS
ncbi:hypothetical protein KEU06_09285 [Pseudaminobacter sp. 19-2017]|uniref:Uncharacterized protein n=1 Tax=Pseudaminobacter soli (ex Zhang et al. 2022) TaxID=2831468 RepID=A0A942I1Z5_9HYPH|nr:hypothetical protein [Pseudaminobacter soli]MBS3648797.1 hypothetical protein [Pseudaminobacter soli]